MDIFYGIINREVRCVSKNAKESEFNWTRH